MPLNKKAAQPKSSDNKAASKGAKSSGAKTAAPHAAKIASTKTASTNTSAAKTKKSAAPADRKTAEKRPAASAARAPVKASTTKAAPKSAKAKATKVLSKTPAPSKARAAATAKGTERIAKSAERNVKAVARSSAPAAKKASTKVSATATKQNAGKVSPAAKITAKGGAAKTAAPKTAAIKSATKPAATKATKPTPQMAKPATNKPATNKTSTSKMPTEKTPATKITTIKTVKPVKPASETKTTMTSATSKRDGGASPRPAPTQKVSDKKPGTSTATPVAGHGPVGRMRTADTKTVAAALLAARRKTIPAKPANDAQPQANGGVDASKGGDQVADKTVKTGVVTQDKPVAPVAPVQTAAPQPMSGMGMMRRPLGGQRPGMPMIAAKAVKPGPRPSFKTNEFVVYPAHGVGQIVAVEQQEVAGYKLELFVISFAKDKMILKVPLPKIASVGMRKLAEPAVIKRALDTLTGRARVKRTMWSRRAQEYEAKINSGDLVAIAEVVRDLYRSDAQPEQSYSERQLYEAALDRMARELSAVQLLTDTEALKVIDDQLRKGPRRGKAEDGESEDSDDADADADEASGNMGEAA